MTKKFDSDAAIQVAEEAFRAGFRAAWELRNQGWQAHPKLEDHAWDDFEPAEDIKELVG